MNALRLTVLVAALVISASATSYEDCGSTSTISSFRVSGCDAPPCTFTRGEQVTIDVDFVSAGDTDVIHSEVAALVDGALTILYKLDSCDFLTRGDCPLTFGELVTYSHTFTIDQAWTPVSTEALFVIEAGPAEKSTQSKDGIVFVCATMAVEVV